MQTALWGLGALLLVVLDVSLLQAALIGASTTGSVALLAPSAEVCTSFSQVLRTDLVHACTMGNAYKRDGMLSCMKVQI